MLTWLVVLALLWPLFWCLRLLLVGRCGAESESRDAKFKDALVTPALVWLISTGDFAACQ